MRYILFLPPAILFGSFLPDLPYAYFQILRWVVTLFSVYYTWHLHTTHIVDMSYFERRWQAQLIFLFVATAILFNPIAPIYLTRTTWLAIDILAGLLMLICGYANFQNRR